MNPKLIRLKAVQRTFQLIRLKKVKQTSHAHRRPSFPGGSINSFRRLSPQFPKDRAKPPRRKVCSWKLPISVAITEFYVNYFSIRGVVEIGAVSIESVRLSPGRRAAVIPGSWTERFEDRKMRWKQRLKISLASNFLSGFCPGRRVGSDSVALVFVGSLNFNGSAPMK